MKPFWIELARLNRPSPLNRGVGITAISEEDAVSLFGELIGTGYTIKSIKEISDVRDLDQNFVVPNMGNLFVRGVWYPLAW
jgi:hypothetical protein